MKQCISQEEIHKKYLYNPATGILTRVTQSREGAEVVKAVGSYHSDGYLQCTVNGSPYMLHRLIYFYMLGVWPDQVDHINGKRDDNRWANLRAATNHLNSGNQGARGGSSKYKGVYWCKRDKSWVARIRIKTGRNGKKRHLGNFQSEVDAAKAYNAAAIEIFGEFARLNIIEQPAVSEAVS